MHYRIQTECKDEFLILVKMLSEISKGVFAQGHEVHASWIRYNQGFTLIVFWVYRFFRHIPKKKNFSGFFVGFSVLFICFLRFFRQFPKKIEKSFRIFLEQAWLHTTP